jgi:hypothetical protein
VEATKANMLAKDIARYIRGYPRPVELKLRVKHITHGQDLDDSDLDQVVRKVRRILFGDHDAQSSRR